MRPVWRRAQEGRASTPPMPPEQLRYAWLLHLGFRTSVVLMLATFAAYLIGWPRPVVPLAQLAELWSLPVAEYLERAGAPAGWSWVTLLDRSDVLNLAMMAVLASISVPCLLAVLPLYLRRRERTYAVLVIVELAVIGLAASGLLDARWR